MANSLKILSLHGSSFFKNSRHDPLKYYGLCSVQLPRLRARQKFRDANCWTSIKAGIA